MSLLEKYQRIRNTFSYSIQSSQATALEDGSGDDIASFQIVIPPFPFPENQQSKLGIFTLESFFFTGQTETVYVSSGAGGLPANSDDDCSGLYVEVNGIGLRPQILTTNVNANLRSNKMFPVINEYATMRKDSKGAIDMARVNCGGYSGKEVICSNPCGTTLEVKVYSMDNGDVITQQALDSIINFKIEMLPDDFQEREMN